MTRLFCLGIILIVALGAVLVSDRSRPMLIDPHSPGPWAFSKADYPLCVTVQPPALRPAPFIAGHRVVPVA